MESMESKKVVLTVSTQGTVTRKFPLLLEETNKCT